MFIRIVHQRSDSGRQAYTLLELSVAMCIASLVATALMSTMVYGVRSAAALNNYTALTRSSRMVTDQLVSDIRGCRSVVAPVTGPWTNLISIALTNLDGDMFSYEFDPSAKTFTRTFNGTSSVLMTNCIGTFAAYQPYLVDGSWNQYSNPASPSQIGIIRVNWKSTRQVLQKYDNTEDVTTAKIYMRNCKKL